MENLDYIDINHLEKYEPSKLIDWIINIKENKIPLPQNFNWLGFAEVAASISQHKNNLLWARVSAEAYDFLMRNNQYEESCFVSLMYLRIYFIKRLGAIKNDSILDLDEIVQCFFQRLSMLLDEVKKIVDNWMKLDISQIRELRRIKNHISLFKDLDTDLLKAYPELLDWMPMHHRLP